MKRVVTKKTVGEVHGFRGLVSRENILVVADDIKVSLFSSSSSFDLEFDLEITSLAFSADNFLVLSDASSSLHFLHIPSRNLVFSKNMSAAFSHLLFSNSDKLFLVSNERMTYFNSLFPIFHAINQNDISRAVKEKENIVSSTFPFADHGFEKISHFSHLDLHDHSTLLFISGFGNSQITIYREKDSDVALIDTLDLSGLYGKQQIIDENIGVLKCLASGSLLYVLDSCNCLTIWNLKTLTIQKRLRKNVTDIALSRNAVCISSKSLNDSKLTISVVCIETGNELYTSLTSDVSLIANAVIDQCYFIESFNSKNVLNALEETGPELALQRLIHECEFDEALSFARKFNIDMIPIQKQKIIHDISQNHVDLSSIKSQLSAINDLQFLVDTTSQIPTSSIAQTYDIFDFARQKVHSLSVVDYELLSIIQKRITRLGTFQLMTPEFEFESWTGFLTCSLVEKIKECIHKGQISVASLIWRRHWLSDSLVNHLTDILEQIPDRTSPSQLVPFLTQLIPGILSLPRIDDVLDWIEDRARVIERIENSPFGAVMVLEVAELIIGGGNMEGLEVGAATPMQFVEDSTAALKKTNIEKRTELRSQLDDLVYLWKDQDYPISLLEYTTSSPSEIAIDILDKVLAPEMIPNAVEKNYKNYVQRNNLPFDKLIVDYCLEMMDKQVGNSNATITEALWEVRVIKLLGCLQTNERKLDVILEIMRRTSVPWSEDVGHWISKALSWPEMKRTEELKEVYRLLRLKRMLIRYGVKGFNISDVSVSANLLKIILSRVDIVDAMDDAMQVVTAYHNLQKSDAYVIRLRSLCKEGQVDRAIRLLTRGSELDQSDTVRENGLEKELDMSATLEPMEVLAYGQDLLEWLVSFLERIVKKEFRVKNTKVVKPSLKATGREVKWILSAAVRFCTELNQLYESFRSKTLHPATSSAFSTGNSTNLLTCLNACVYLDANSVVHFKNLKALFDEFGVVCCFKMFWREDFRREMLSEAAKDAFQYGEKNLEGRMTLTAINRFAELLNFERSRLRAILAEEAAQSGDFKTALVLCKELYQKFPDSETAQTLSRVARKMSDFCATNQQVYTDMKESKMNTRLTSQIMELSRKALALCSKDNLSDNLDEFGIYELQHEIFVRCDAGDYNILLEKENKNLRTKRDQPVPNLRSSSSSSSSSTYRAFEPQTNMGTSQLEITNLGDTFAMKIFDHFYRETGMVLNTVQTMSMVGEFVSSFYNLMLKLNQNPYSPIRPKASPVKFSPNKSKGKSAKPQSVDDIDLVLDNAKTLLGHLKTNGSLQVAYFMFQRMMELLIGLRNNANNSEQNFIGNWEEFIHTELIQSLASSTLVTGNIDLRLAVAYVLSSSLDILKANMKSAKLVGGFNQTTQLSAVGEFCAVGWNSTTFAVQCTDTATKSKWFGQFKLLDILYDENDFKDSELANRIKYVTLLLDKTGGDILTAFEFANTFGVSDDYVIIEYIKTVLFSPNMNDNDMMNGIVGVIDDVANKEMLQKVLIEDCLERVNSYDYERLQFILHQIQRLDPENETCKMGLGALEVVKNYERSQPPTLKELNSAIRNGKERIKKKSVKEITEMHPKSLRRLPYHSLLSNTSEVLDPEVDDENFSKLLPLCVPLKTTYDAFYMRVFEKLLLSNENGPLSGEAGKIKFEKLKPLLLKIQDAQTAVQTSSLVAGMFGCGPEQILAHKLTIQIGERHLRSLIASSEEYRKIEEFITEKRTTLHRSEIEYALRNEGFEDLIQYLTQPRELIKQLYEKKGALALRNDTLDVHGLVDDIGKRFKIDVSSLRSKLFLSWLKQDSSVEDTGNTYLPSIRMRSDNVLSNDTESALQSRLMYLVERIDDDLKVLLSFAYKSDRINSLARIRTLALICKRYTAEEIYKEGQMEYQQLKIDFTNTLYLGDFEELRISQKLKTFANCDKEALGRSLWLNHNNNPKALQLLCNLCLDYKIFDIMLWESVLERLLDFGLYQYLLGVLEQISTIPELSMLKNIPKIWNKVLLGTLDILGEEKTTNFASYYKIFTLIQKCPFLPDLQMDELMKRFIGVHRKAKKDDVKMIVLALNGLTVIPQTSDTEKAKEDIVLRLSEAHMILLLDEISPPAKTRGEMKSLPHGLILNQEFIEQVVYNYFDSKALYTTIAKSNHLMRFCTYLIKQDKAQNVILASVIGGRVKSAMELTVLYYRRYPDEMPDISVEDEDEAETAVKFLRHYLKTHECRQKDDIPKALKILENF
ncbi:hypothetical protein HK098_004157 [Nowakowskiella sp. JEL0407]|nr:hypothetical protein HK098_004157 [Nowakowskiella sp. JEL0407]